MLSAFKPVCFVATAKSAAAKKFYRDTLGLTLVEDGPFAIVFDANGTTLRVQKVESVSPAGYTVLGWEVDDIERAVQRLTKKGVRFEQYAGLPQDELGVWIAPSGARVAWFKDPDGNTLSLSQANGSSKQPRPRWRQPVQQKRKTPRRG
jgi:catechol 2,3-dioxygenase-like lactoylglutathione lyase family enzyme